MHCPLCRASSARNDEGTKGTRRNAWATRNGTERRPAFGTRYAAYNQHHLVWVRSRSRLEPKTGLASVVATSPSPLCGGYTNPVNAQEQFMGVFTGKRRNDNAPVPMRYSLADNRGLRQPTPVSRGSPILQRHGHATERRFTAPTSESG